MRTYFNLRKKIMVSTVINYGITADLSVKPERDGYDISLAEEDVSLLKAS
jgi:hypothetical protein